MAGVIGFVRRHPWQIATVPLIAVALVATLAFTSVASTTDTYRTTTVTTGDVTQVLTATASLESASRYDVGFQVGGTVDSVEVAVGDEVEAGQVLATLDTDDLEDAVTEAEETLAAAEEALAEDLEAQSSSSSDSSSTSTASYSAGESTTTATVQSAMYVVSEATTVITVDDEAAGDSEGDDGAGDSDDVESARTALLAAQQALLDQYDVTQALLAAAETAQEYAQDVCTVFAETAAADDSEDDGSGSEDSGDDAGDSGDDAEDAVADALEACQEATEDALLAQQEAFAAQTELMTLADEVDAAVAVLQEAIEASADGGDEPTPGDGDGSGDDSGTGAGGGDAGDMSGDGGAPSDDSGDADAFGDMAGDASGDMAADGTTTDDTSADDSSPMSGATGTDSDTDSVPSAADILADKAEITAAEAALAVAEQQLEYAEIVAPVAGEVIAVALAEDDTVSAGDTEAVITIVADNTYLAELSVSLTEAQLLEAGQEAAVTLTSTGEVVSGVVSSVSSVNSGNAFSQAYAVTIAIPDPGFDIRIGAATRMEITVGSATGVVVVPTSAVADAAGDATVQVIGDDGEPETVSIEVGAIGSTYTEVVSGLDVGDEVILADLTEELTSDDEDEDSDGGLLSGLSDDESSTDTGEMGTPPGGADFGGGMAPGGQAG